ncbi:MAG: FAD-binding oxidoreductase [Candidatus Thorarchaeota archaeon]|nr:FAD-binding oxidoreductase [Candidatus Thorarchaeota archaeon]
MTETKIGSKPEPTPPAAPDTSILGQLREVVGEERVSDSELERVVYSGDPSSLPQYHYRWKGKYLADYVVRVENVNEIEEVLKVAREHKLPIIPRGGASSCMGSSSPSRGGISLDIKPMNKILEVNKESMFIRVEAGVTFERLENELEKQGLTLGIYPSSAKSAVIGGWIACGGRGGIGTPYYGSLREHTLSLSVAGGDGAVHTIESEDIDLFSNSYGILGVIFEVTLKVHELAHEHKTFSYGFRDLQGLCNAMMEVAGLEKKPIYLKIADEELQKYSNPLGNGRFVLTATYIDAPNNIPSDELSSITGKNDGVFLGEEFSEKEWELRYDAEFNPKEHTETLMFQELWMPIDRVYEMLSAYESYRKSHKISALWFGMLGTPDGMRLELMTMINADQYLKFISSKGILHKMVKKAIKSGGAPYTIGLQNSIYMTRAYPDRLVEMQEAKEKWDPDGIMNPDRVTSCLTSFRRIDVLFALATAFRRLSRYVGK